MFKPVNSASPCLTLVPFAAQSQHQSQHRSICEQAPIHMSVMHPASLSLFLVWLHMALNVLAIFLRELQMLPPAVMMPL